MGTRGLAIFASVLGWLGAALGTQGAQALTLRPHSTPRWAIQQVSAPAGSSGQLAGVACTSSSTCMSVGSYSDRSGVQVTLAERLTGTRSSITTTRNPSGAVSSSLNGVSCRSSTSCTAVGAYVSLAGGGGPLAERWTGTSWSITAVPSPAGTTGGSLSGVSCSSSTSCFAVGAYQDSSGGQSPLAERWNGTSWSIMTVPVPAGTTYSTLEGVSCTSSTNCFAVGSYAGSGADLTLAEHWNGTSWAITTTPNPTGASSSELRGVSCTSRTVCTAVGSSSVLAAVPLAERWDGSRWSIQAVPSSGDYSNTAAVSCPSHAACTAVGDSSMQTGPDVTLAEHANGPSWSAETTPNPSGAIVSRLSGVSCTSDSVCTAVGSSGGLLVERQHPPA